MRSSKPTTRKTDADTVEIEIGAGTWVLPATAEDRARRARTVARRGQAWPGRVIRAVASGLARAIVHDGPVTSRWYY